MARPKMRIFGVLVAVGGWLALRHMQRHRVAQVSGARELSRWEDEGGNVAPSAALSDSAAGSASVSPSPSDQGNGTNGAAHPNGNGDAWPFPRG